ncbi:AraC family transcriptional regulator ligand-binding domain-containing protein [Paraglaciecola arctica]|uniref:AraC family transcriptional regulator ligand-binding domain-containing protein n=1 Tax=Paraglaciecola arctica TaxID=1128911 RepID=UPI001C06693F|nr:AraC family transcriptional regulator ligand-binding domain-containing protein [Paraglaciecola arctica]MBU3006291.1 AraC family transcriptional regulator ligand-binding domain-containing protein [Paraglaciecola arctica]
MKVSATSFLCLEDKYIPAHQLAASLVDYSVSRGVNKHKLLRGTRIFSEDLKSDKKISLGQLLQLLSNVRTQTPGYDCAFQIGRRLFPSNYGAVSNALLHSRDFAQALKILNILRMQICPFFDASSYQTKQRQYLLINPALGCHTQVQFLSEIYCSALISATKLLFGQRIPMYFSFPFQKPKYIQEYQENIGYRLSFSQPMFSISFEKKWLTTPCLQRSDGLRSYAIKQARLQNLPKQGFLQAVRHEITKHRQASLNNIASQFSISPATFKRKLKLHNTHFKQLQDELGKQQATYLLQIQQFSNEQSAHLMQFNDIPNFRRSVKRWTGLTPSQLRLVE